MGIFSGKGFVGSCFRGWGSSNMAVQAVGCMIGMVVLEQVNDAEALVAQLSRISGYSEELARRQVSSCPTCLMKGLDQEGADDMQVLLQVNDCSVVSVKEVGI